MQKTVAKENPGQSATIEFPTRGTRRKRRRMNLGQNNLIMIAFKERRETRSGEVKNNRRTKEQVNT